MGQALATSTHTLLCFWGNLGETRSSEQQLQTCFLPWGPEANATCASSREPVQRSLCKCAFSVPAVGGGPNMCVCVLQEEKQHDAAVTF